jgi:hypothetical protein
MSGGELIGKYGEQYKEASEKARTLRVEAGHWGPILIAAGQSLMGVAGNPNSIPDPNLLLSSLPNKDELMKLVADIAEATQSAVSAREQLRQLGIDVK